MTDPCRLSIDAELEYDVDSSSSFAFAVAAARTERQSVTGEHISVSPEIDVRLEAYGEAGSHQLLRLDAPPGRLVLTYQAVAAIQPRTDDPAELGEMSFGAIPAEVLPYLNPSRYCESDTVAGLAGRLFGGSERGYARVQEVNDWVRTTLAYEPGTTDGTTSACDVLVQRAGVCRDFAHVAITLCRALGIPARYVAGYGLGVEPQDFHGFFEAYLDGEWWLFDPTGMTAADQLVRIGYGRDAADASFATFVGHADLVSKVVTVEAADPVETNAEQRTDGAEAATSTA